MAARIDVSIEHKHAPPETDGKPHPNTCPRCGSHYRDDELAQHLNVCPNCGHHFPMRARARIEQLVDAATERGIPLVSVPSSGGARMQEGILSLMQLPKTVVAVEELHDAGGTLISVMAHPTTAGVLASFASLGDVIVAEPGALLSFTGPRVVQQTTREKLPDDFGLAESNFRHGHVDAIVPRPELRPTLGRLLRLFANGR